MLIWRIVSLSFVAVSLSLSYSNSAAWGAVQTMTDRGVMVLTSTGIVKVEQRLRVVGRGVSALSMFGRLAGPVTVGLALLEGGSLLWDWYSATFTPTSVPTQAGGAVFEFGEQAGGTVTLVGMWSPSPCGQSNPLKYAKSGYEIPAGKRIIGGSVVYSYGGCGPQYNQYLRWVNAETTGASLSNVAESTPPQLLAGPGSRDALVSKLERLRDDLRQGVLTPPGLTELQAANGGTSPVGDVLSDIIAAIDALKTPLTLTATDRTAGPTPELGNPTLPGNEIPSGTATGTGTATDMTSTNNKLDTIASKLDTQNNTAASPATPQACETCSRVDKWQQAWDSIKAAGLSAPVFGLISKLIISPAGGGAGLCDTVMIQTSMAGTLSLQGSSWSCSTLLAAFRFAIIGSALIVGYLVLFG